MIGLLTLLGTGRRFPGLAPVVHTRTTNGSEVVTVPTYYRFADVYAVGAGGVPWNATSSLGGSGGGGGGAALAQSIAVAPGDTFTLLVSSDSDARVTEDATGAYVEGRLGGPATASAGGGGGGRVASGTFSGSPTPQLSNGGDGADGSPEIGGSIPGAGGIGGVSGLILLGENTLIPSAPGAPGVLEDEAAENTVGVGCGGSGGATKSGAAGTSGPPAAIVVFRTH